MKPNTSSLPSQDLVETLKSAERRLLWIRLGLFGAFVGLVVMFALVIANGPLKRTGRFVNDVGKTTFQRVQSDPQTRETLGRIALAYETSLRDDLSSAWPDIAKEMKKKYASVSSKSRARTRDTFKNGLKEYLSGEEYGALIDEVEKALGEPLTVDQRDRLGATIKDVLTVSATETVKRRLDEERELVGSFDELAQRLSAGSSKGDPLENAYEKLKNAGHGFVPGGFIAAPEGENE